jgi:hypothetical protein
MKKKRIQHILLGIFTVIALSAGPAFLVELIFKDLQYSFQTLRTLGYSVSGGADVGEVLKTACAVEEGDDESWFQEWVKTAEQREKAGDVFLKEGRRISARQEFFKASNYYRTAEFFLKEVDPKRIALTGISFGGYLAPRAAAFEKRIKACIANSGIYDFKALSEMV